MTPAREKMRLFLSKKLMSFSPLPLSFFLSLDYGLIKVD